MMKKTVGLLIVVSAIFGCIFIHREVVKAVEMNFSVSAIIPDNQIDKSKAYFDLRVVPGQVQVLEVLMTNRNDHPVTVETSARTAMTNNKGYVDYDNIALKMDDTLVYPFSEIAELPKEVTIPARETIALEVKVTMPSKPFSGMILGGLYFSEKADLKGSSKDESAENERVYVIGVMISENSAEVRADMKLNQVKPAQDNQRNVLKANIQNTKPVILQNLSVDAHVYQEGSETLLHETKVNGLRMAPNSNFDFGISWDNEKFKPGKYRLKMVVTSENQSWKWDEPFEIEENVAADFNSKAVETKWNDRTWYIVGGSVMGLSVVGIIFVWWGRSREDDDQM